MRSIEERAKYWSLVYCESNYEGLLGALTELAADLQAEKEKEVAELREELLAFGKYVADRYDDAVLYKRSVKLSGGIDGDLSLIVSAQRAVQLISESEESGWVVKAVDAKRILINAIQNHPDTYLIDEVKRVLGNALVKIPSDHLLPGKTTLKPVVELINQAIDHLGDSHE